ncbi:MAG: hypothetical protein ACE5HA_14915 [Anaerolineae bacterium]
MSQQEVLILAMTKMLSGICTAGFTTEPDPISGLKWVRPVKEHGTLLLGDMTDADGRVVQCSDVVSLNFRRPRPDPPHTEDVVMDFVYRRPELRRRLEGERRAHFFAEHLDKRPEDILIHETRSLCLVKPDHLWARFELDAYSGKYQARLGFVVDDIRHPRASSPSGVPVTDMKWRALGRAWLGEAGGLLDLDEPTLKARLNADDIYLALGLSRTYEGNVWLLVVGVHVVPDYEMEIDYNNP